MTKIVCDFCGKGAGNQSVLLDTIKEYNFCISRYGIRLDMCEDCKKSLNEWWKQRKALGEKENVLDKIKAEIEQMNNIDYVNPITVGEVIEIIDKYKGESEDKK